MAAQFWHSWLRALGQPDGFFEPADGRLLHRHSHLDGEPRARMFASLAQDVRRKFPTQRTGNFTGQNKNHRRMRFSVHTGGSWPVRRLIESASGSRHKSMTGLPARARFRRAQQFGLSCSPTFAQSRSRAAAPLTSAVFFVTVSHFAGLGDNLRYRNGWWASTVRLASSP
jgi:hypothetical protein